MAKPKNTELNFLYMEDKSIEKEKQKTKNKVRSKKKNVRADDPKSAHGTEAFNFENEIVIGVTKVPDEKEKINHNAKKVTNRRNGKKSKESKAKEKNDIQNNNKLTKKEINEVKKRRKKQEDARKRKTVSKKNINNRSKKSKIIKGIVKWTFLLSMFAASFIFFMMSPLFDLATVEVANNEKINSDTIISLSGLTIGENIYKTSTKQIQKNIKQNAYIESVQIKRQLPNKILINVKERKATYMLEYATSFAYINNQGYILEISEEKLNVPVITGYTTSQEEIKTGSRMNNEDLERLSTVLKIMESANVNGIGDLVSKIDIQNKQNYVLILESEKKTVYLGDASDLSNRMLYLKAVLEQEKGVEGEIFINGDLNKQDVYFRMK